MTAAGLPVAGMTFADGTCPGLTAAVLRMIRSRVPSGAVLVLTGMPDLGARLLYMSGRRRLAVKGVPWIGRG